LRVGDGEHISQTDQKNFSQLRVVLANRDQYVVEHAFYRLKGKCLSLTPIHVQKDEMIEDW
jgi:transposase